MLAVRAAAAIACVGWRVSHARSSCQLLHVQALPCAFLLWRLARSYRLKLDPPALRQVAQLFGPTLYTLLRTMAITLTYALATSLVTRAGPSAAACHQVSQCGTQQRTLV